MIKHFRLPRYSEMAGLLGVPIEIIFMICGYLDINQLFNFGATCQHLHYILKSESICRVALQQAKFSPEAIEAQSTRAYAKGFRKLAKRRNAVRFGEPFLVALVGWGIDFIYTNGVLCYSLDHDTLRVLDIHHSATTELKVSAASCLTSAIPEFSWSTPYRFTPVHYCEGILTCHLTQRAGCSRRHWVVILDIKNTEILGCERIASSWKLFVRNNHQYVFYGIKSRPEIDGPTRWEITRFDVPERKAVEQVLMLWNFDGDEMGSDLCFEIFDDYFYCVSTKPNPRREVSNSRFYHVVRFPLDRPSSAHLEQPPLTSVWRRNIREGFADPRWNSLQLVRDEETGKIFIYECRKESLRDNAQSQRFCFKKEIKFDETQFPAISRASSPGILGNQGQRGQNLDDGTDDGQDEHSDEEGFELDLESYTEERAPENVHIGDDGNLGTNFPFHECFVRSYIPSCETFVDIVSTPPFSMPDTQQLHLRTRPRRETGSNGGRSTLSSGNLSTCDPLAATATLDQRYFDHGVHFWPHNGISAHFGLTPTILRDILDANSLVSELSWAMDDRSLVYSSAGKKEFKPIILVSFDSGIHLSGFKKPLIDSDSAPADESSPNGSLSTCSDHEKMALSEASTTTSYRTKEPDVPPSTDNSIRKIGSFGGQLEARAVNDPSPSPAAIITPCWGKPIEAFYLKVPKVFANHTYGLDTAL